MYGLGVGDLNSFRNISELPVEGGQDNPALSSPSYHLMMFDVRNKNIYGLEGGEFNGFQDIKSFPLLWPHPTLRRLLF
jgi:hypothetical protein